MSKLEKEKWVDPECRDLAEYFLTVDDRRKRPRDDDVKSLAADIQSAVEEWFFIRDALPEKETGITS